MASYSVAKAKHATLVASTADTVTLTGEVGGKAVIINEDGAAAIYVTSDGVTAATVAGDNTDFIPAQAGAFIEVECDGSKAVISLISAGTPAYSVIGGTIDELDRGSGSGGTGTTVTTDASASQRGTLTNKSTTITAGATAQTLAAANAARKYLFVLNPSTESETLWINFTTTAVAASPSIPLLPGQSFVFEGKYVSTELVSVIAATTGHVVIAKEG